jgi:hypothetical protein
MSRLTLLDLAKRNGNSAQVGLIESLLKVNALAERMPFFNIQGMSYQYGQRSGLPNVERRGFNDGIDDSKSTIVQKVSEAKIIGGRSVVDKLLAEADPRGVNAYRAEEDSGFGSAMFNQFATDVYYGNSTTDAKQFDGISKILSALSQETVINAGGTGGGSVYSSIYAISFNDVMNNQGRIRAASGFLGNGKNITPIDMGLEYALDKDSKKYLAYHTEFEFQPGFAVYDDRSVGRIANIDASNKPSITHLNQLYTAMYPFFPSALFCSKAVFNYIQELKGTTFTTIDPLTQKEIFVRAQTFDGVPIFIDESISDTEAEVS